VMLSVDARGDCTLVNRLGRHGEVNG
jgi:hypothetical protein